MKAKTLDSSPWEAMESLEAAITICDADLRLISMNGKALASFGMAGGEAPTGMDLRECHKEQSVATMEDILRTGVPNVYTIKKKGLRKMIWQAPWTKEGNIAGLVEISFILPLDIPHFDRD
ncbi:MAG: PAS fold [Spirochaetes bacterium]|nr:MAG: PAS fold [Spirochaetota bacterium]